MTARNMIDKFCKKYNYQWNEDEYNIIVSNNYCLLTINKKLQPSNDQYMEFVGSLTELKQIIKILNKKGKEEKKWKNKIKNS